MHAYPGRRGRAGCVLRAPLGGWGSGSRSRGAVCEHEDVEKTTTTMAYDPPLDPGVEPYVGVLAAAGIETFESCDGGKGHAYSEPTIRFHGDRSEGFRAIAVALQHDLPVSDLRRIWTIIDGEPTGPDWELTFYRLVSAPGA